MSTIRRHGVAFHLIPTPVQTLWLEVIRESDGAVLASEEFRGDSDDDLAPAVEEWFDDIVLDRINGIEIPTCRSCGSRQREAQRGEDGRILPEYLIEWDFDLCIPCASQFEQANPWLRAHVEGQYYTDPFDD